MRLRPLLRTLAGATALVACSATPSAAAGEGEIASLSAFVASHGTVERSEPVASCIEQRVSPIEGCRILFSFRLVEMPHGAGQAPVVDVPQEVEADLAELSSEVRVERQPGPATLIIPTRDGSATLGLVSAFTTPTVELGEMEVPQELRQRAGIDGLQMLLADAVAEEGAPLWTAAIQGCATTGTER